MAEFFSSMAEIYAFVWLIILEVGYRRVMLPLNLIHQCMRISGAKMSIFLNPHTARATTGADRRTQIIALSSVIAAGALLLDASAVLGVVGCLVLLLALMVAFIAGHLLTRWQPWPARYCLAIACYAFLLSAAGWLLLLIAWHGACDWLEFVPGVVVAGLGLGIAWQNNEVEKRRRG
ncbi:hypothetical protein [Edwardsiella tarda]|uniref:hypothetical protein n=1 Tax=Edwardsiella tarda TaxID=636 RepID=UPI00351C773E